MLIPRLFWQRKAALTKSRKNIEQSAEKADRLETNYSAPESTKSNAGTVANWGEANMW